jgi:two-component system phosphate regulon sensor histidine kinase PhoR
MAPGEVSSDVPLLLLLLAAGAAIGGALGNAWFGAAFAFGVYLYLCARRLRFLMAWLAQDQRQDDPPSLGGPLGAVVQRVKTMHDRLRAEIADRDSRVSLLRESFSALKDGIVILDDSRAIEWCNPGARRLLGLRYPEDKGQQIGNLLRYPGFHEFLAAGDSETDFEFTVPDSRGLTLQVQAAAFGEASMVLFVRDLTALKRLETIRQDFVGNISHELRTPLTVIAGYVDTLADLLDSDSPVIAKVLSQMRQQSVRMENLLKDLLLLSQFENSDQPDTSAEEFISVCAMLESIRENALTACSGERRISLDCDASLRFRASRVEIESVFSNLIFNAVKYTQPGGRVDVRFRRCDAGVEFLVKDDGIGIDPVHIPRLTERFYRVDKGRSTERGGTGLGLAIVKHALIRLGGEMDVESRPGAGSTFRCVFPAERLIEDPAPLAVAVV